MDIQKIISLVTKTRGLNREMAAHVSISWRRNRIVGIWILDSVDGTTNLM